MCELPLRSDFTRERILKMLLEVFEKYILNSCKIRIISFEPGLTEPSFFQMTKEIACVKINLVCWPCT